LTTVTDAWRAVGVGLEDIEFPSTLSFGNVVIGTSKALQLTISNAGEGDLTVSNITSDDAHFTPLPTSFTVTPGSSQAVTVTFATNVLLPGSQSGTLTITHNGLDSPTLVTMTGDAAVGASTSAINFVASGGSASVTITNPAAVNIDITAIATNNSQFSVSHGVLPITILPGLTTDIGIDFTPLAGSGVQVATLAITHNPTILITMTGGTPFIAGSSSQGQKVASLRVPFGGGWMAVLLMGSCGCYALKRRASATDRRGG
jgi:P pilus assembly chaperone PapD